MKNFLRFLISRVFLINLAVAIVLISGSLWLLMVYLDSETLHGESVTVPDFMGQKVEDLDDFVSGKEVTYLIVDSTFDISKAHRTVINQEPPANFEVKPGRRIYLTINQSTTPQRRLPELRDLQFRQAIAQLEIDGFVIKSVVPEPGPNEGVVVRIEQKGEEVLAGTLLDRGSKLDVVYQSGEDRSKKIRVPYLVRMTYSEAESYLKNLGLNVGNVSFSGGCENAADSAGAQVRGQFPEAGPKAVLFYGNLVDLELTCDPNEMPDFGQDTNFYPDSAIIPEDTVLSTEL